MNENDRMHFVLLNRWARRSMSWIDVMVNGAVQRVGWVEPSRNPSSS